MFQGLSQDAPCIATSHSNIAQSALWGHKTLKQKSIQQREREGDKNDEHWKQQKKTTTTEHKNQKENEFSVVLDTTACLLHLLSTVSSLHEVPELTWSNAAAFQACDFGLEEASAMTPWSHLYGFFFFFFAIDFVKGLGKPCKDTNTHVHTNKHAHTLSDRTACFIDWSTESSVTFRGIGVAGPIDQNHWSLKAALWVGGSGGVEVDVGVE